MTRSSFENEDHEEIVVRRGRRSGVTTMVAVHSRALGPAAGGTRLRAYPDLGAAIRDVLRLSQAMTAKCAVAGIPFGGAKSVIALPEGAALTPEQRRAVLLDHAELIASFDGSYLAGPDVGTSPDDMAVLREVTPHAFCLPESMGGTGSSSGPTAAGVLAALRAGARAVFGSSDMAGKRVVVSGFGSVGAHVATGLAAAGAEVIVSDVVAALRATAQERGFGWVEPDKALTLTADVVVPAAVGGVLSADTVSLLAAPLVVGPANNQLTSADVAGLLQARDITWVPDVVASGGGVIYTLGREADGLSHTEALARVDTIEQTVETILAAAAAAGTTPLDEAMRVVRERLAGV